MEQGGAIKEISSITFSVDGGGLFSGRRTLNIGYAGTKQEYRGRGGLTQLYDYIFEVANKPPITAKNHSLLRQISAHLPNLLLFKWIPIILLEIQFQKMRHHMSMKNLFGVLLLNVVVLNLCGLKRALKVHMIN